METDHQHQGPYPWFHHPTVDHVILEKKGRTVSVQCLRDGTVSTTSIYEVKANWTINSRKGRFDLVKHWKQQSQP